MIANCKLQIAKLGIRNLQFSILNFQSFLVVCLFLLLPMLMLYPLWACPTSAGEDDVVYYWPLRVMAAEQIQAGHWPWWDKGEATGVPLFADPQAGVLFPPNWLFLVAPAKLAYSLCLFLAFSVAGGGAYRYLRRTGVARTAALFGGVAFMFCGFMIGHRVHLGLIQTAAFLPWGLWAIERLRRQEAYPSLSFGASREGAVSSGDTRAGLPALRPEPPRWFSPGVFVGMALVFALTLAAGHWPTAIEMTLVWLVYLLVRARPVRRAIITGAAAVAVGSALVAPQIVETVSYLGQTIRNGVPYAVAGENSFFPFCGLLALYPFGMGCRTPNALAGPWWGPWHLCEMLGYVGLATLVLAASAVWRLWRRPKEPPISNPQFSISNSQSAMVPLVRLWTVFVIVAGVWALGYYLPTFQLLYRIPFFGAVRCPARMLLVIDLGLCVLAAMAIDSLAKSASDTSRLAGTVRRWLMAYLPACMVLALGLVWLAGAGQSRGWWDLRGVLADPPNPPLPQASAAGLLQRAWRPTLPAVFVPLLMTVTTAGVGWWFLRRPGRHAGVLILLVLADLFFIARFVDMPGKGYTWPDPTDSPAARFLRERSTAAENAAVAPDAAATYRVWGLGRNLHDRPAELLLPKTAAALGFETIAYYGPLQPAAHAQLLGFRPWGANEHWEQLIRRNHLLSVLNVRYILAAEPEFRQAIESVGIPAEPPAPDGPNLLLEQWSVRNAEVSGGVIHLKSPSIWSQSYASQPVRLEGGGFYRIALDIRAQRGAGNYVSVEYADPQVEGYGWGQAGFLRVDLEQVTPSWRHFERSFVAPPRSSGQAILRVFTPGDRAVEVWNVSLRRSSQDAPVNLGGRLAPGEAVYVDLTPEGLPSLRDGDPPVHVYENRLCLPRSFQAESVALENQDAVIEALRWRPEEFDSTRQVLVVGDGGQEGIFTSEARRTLDPAEAANVLGRLTVPGHVSREFIARGFLGAWVLLSIPMLAFVSLLYVIPAIMNLRRGKYV